MLDELLCAKKEDARAAKEVIYNKLEGYEDYFWQAVVQPKAGAADDHQCKGISAQDHKGVVHTYYPRAFRWVQASPSPQQCHLKLVQYDSLPDYIC